MRYGYCRTSKPKQSIERQIRNIKAAYREVLGAAEGMKEDKASWISFFQWLRSRGLDGVKLIVGDKCLGMLEAVGDEVWHVFWGVHPVWAITW